VLNPTSDESKRRDKLKKRKNEHTESKHHPKKERIRVSSIQFIVYIQQYAHVVLLLLYVLNSNSFTV